MTDFNQQNSDQSDSGITMYEGPWDWIESLILGASRVVMGAACICLAICVFLFAATALKVIG